MVIGCLCGYGLLVWIVDIVVGYGCYVFDVIVMVVECDGVVFDDIMLCDYSLLNVEVGCVLIV